MSLIVELAAHCYAGDRAYWRGEQDQRPLAELGRYQAEALASELAKQPIDGLYASPAVRCIETLAPLSRRTGLPVQEVPGLRERQPSDTLDTMGERGYSAITEIAASAEGRVVICSHGDIIPAAVDILLRRYRLVLPRRLGKRGEWYSIEFADQPVAIRLNSAAPDLPH